MEFNIRKKATLPYLEVNLIKNGRLDFNYIETNLSGSTIYFYMKDVETEVYKIAKGVCVYSTENNSIYYQFTKKIQIMSVDMREHLKLLIHKVK